MAQYGADIGTYEFDGDLLVVQQICSLEDHTKRSLSNFLPHSVMHTDDVGRRGCHFELRDYVGLRKREVKLRNGIDSGDVVELISTPGDEC